MLVVEVDGLTTKGDMAMAAAGVTVVTDGNDLPEVISEKLQAILAKYNPELTPSAYRLKAVLEQVESEKRTALREERSKTFFGSFINAFTSP